jgi:hypothetical protein
MLSHETILRSACTKALCNPQHLLDCTALHVVLHTAAMRLAHVTYAASKAAANFVLPVKHVQSGVLHVIYVNSTTCTTVCCARAHIHTLHALPATLRHAALRDMHLMK